MSKVAKTTMSNWEKWKQGFIVLSSGTLMFVAHSVWQGNEDFYRDYVMPSLRIFPPETAHNLAVKTCKYRLIPRMKKKEYPSLETEVFCMKFKNPVGMAAGFDKHGEAVDGLLQMGFGFVEVGSVTPKPQPGNAKPRLFRLPEDEAVINRFGFNSDGHAVVHTRLKARLKENQAVSEGPSLGKDAWIWDRNRANVIFWSPGTWSEFPSFDDLSQVIAKSRYCTSWTKGIGHWYEDRNFLNVTFWSPGCWSELPNIDTISQDVLHSTHIPTGLKKVPGILGVNLGKNKTSIDAVDDYVRGVHKFGDVADYLVINISSPNTPGLRDLQGSQQLEELVQKVVEERNELKGSNKPPILVKIAPDLSEKDKIDIAAVVARPGSGVDGLVVSNTTVSRPDSLQSKHRTETGGLSGQPLKHMSTECIKDMYRLTQGRLPIIGVGGVASGQDALDKIEAGASLVQLYSSIVYHGPPLVNRIQRELSELLQENGYSNVSSAVGASHKQRKQDLTTS